MDYIFTFNAEQGDYAKIIKKWLPWKADRIFSFGHPYEWSYTQIYEKNPSCAYFGRAASFKHPEDMIPLAKLRRTTMPFAFYGIGRTLEGKKLLDAIEASGEKYLYLKPSETPVGSAAILVYNVMNNIDMQSKMKKTMFGFSGYRLPAQNYGNKFEFVMAEMIDNQCICIFSKHALENMYLPSGLRLIDTNAFIPYDNNPEEVAKIMEYFANNEAARKTRIEEQYRVLDKFMNTVGRVDEVLDKIKGQQTVINSDTLFKTLVREEWRDIPGIAYDPADLKLKTPRVYIQKGPRLRKELYVRS